MNGSFTLLPHHGSQFNLDQIREFLLSHAAVLPAEHRDDMLIVARDAEEAANISAALEREPEKPQWAIFIHLSPERLLVYREAPQETLDYFYPILKTLMGWGIVGSIKDEEGREVPMDDVEELCRTLLI